MVSAFLDFLTYGLCAPYSETTDGAQFDSMLELVAERGRSLFKLFLVSPDGRQVDVVTISMKSTFKPTATVQNAGLYCVFIVMNIKLQQSHCDVGFSGRCLTSGTSVARQHPSLAIVKGAGLVMRAIIEEGDAATAQRMQVRAAPCEPAYSVEGNGRKIIRA